MGLEHLDAVWQCSRQSGSHLIVLLAVASHSDPDGVWVSDQATLQGCARLTNRRVRQILTELVADGELAVVSHHGRGKLSIYRLLVGKESGQENWKSSAALPVRKEEADSRLSKEKPEADSQPSSQILAAENRFSSEKLAAGSQIPAPLAPPCPPFPPHPQFPPNPPHSPGKTKKEKQETFGLRPLTGPQGAVFRVNLLLEEAGVPLPTPAQIGLWSKTLGGIEPLLDLLGRLVQAGLANKREPIVYAHRVVMEQAARPATPARPAPGTVLDARAGRELLWSAGGDEIRWQQAQEIIANTEKS